MGDVTRIHDNPEAHEDCVKRFDPDGKKFARLTELATAHRVANPAEFARNTIEILVDPTFSGQAPFDRPATESYISDLVGWQGEPDVLVETLDDAGIVEIVSGYMPTV